MAEDEEGLGIPRGLEEEFVGPDAGWITAEERQRRIDEYLADLVFGEKGYRVARHMERIAGSRLGVPAGGRAEPVEEQIMDEPAAAVRPKEASEEVPPAEEPEIGLETPAEPEADTARRPWWLRLLGG